MSSFALKWHTGRRAAFIAVAATALASHAVARNQDEDRAGGTGLDGKAVIAVVSIKDQRISLYDAKGGSIRARISSGQSGYETPVGVFSILQKNVDHHSNLYDDASMPFMQRLTWSGVALHAGALPGYPASHGCVRLPYEFAKRIFSLTKLGTRVVLSRDDIAPVEISHRLLLKPVPVQATPVDQAAVATPIAYSTPEDEGDSVTLLKPDVRSWPARQALLEDLQAAAKAESDQVKAAVKRWQDAKVELNKHSAELALVAKRERAAQMKSKAESRLAKADQRLAKATSPREQARAQKSKADAEASLAAAEAKLTEATNAAAEADKVIERLNAEIATAEAAKTASAAAAAEARRKTLPISVFISAKSQRLYVRQGNEPVFDAPVEVADPGAPIGTHVFTALGFTEDQNDVQWNVVTISQRSKGEAEESSSRKRKREKASSYAPPLTDAAAAAAALERVSIPADVRSRISEYVWPGSSMIISDEDLHKETDKATDFIVVMSDEPQGALTIRKRQPPPPRYYREFDEDDEYEYSDRYYYREDRRRVPERRYKGLFGLW